MPPSNRRKFLTSAPLAAAAASLPAGAWAENGDGRKVSTDEPRAALDVMAFGAVGDGAADDSAAIQAALAAAEGRPVLVPAGSYRVDSTIAIPQRGHLILSTGSVLRRVAAAESTEPVVRLGTPHARLTGYGTVFSEKASPRGVVHVGPASQNKLTNISWTHIDGIDIGGQPAPGNYGLYFDSSEPVVGGSNYLSNVRNVRIYRVARGVHLGPVCNAHTFMAVNFYRITERCWDLHRCSENNAHGGFTHFSANATVIHIEAGNYNQFYGVLAEPGRQSRYYNIVSGTWNAIYGHDNCVNAPIDHGARSTIIANSRAKVASLSASSIAAGPHRLGQSGSKSAVPAGGGTAVCDISGSGTMFVELDVVVAATGSSANEAHFHFRRLTAASAGTDGGETEIEELLNRSEGEFAVTSKDFAVTRPGNGTIRITYTNSGRAATEITFFAQGVNLASMTVA